MPTLNTTVLRGLPVTIDYSVEPDDRSVGYRGGVNAWDITHIAGKPCKNPKWLYVKLDDTEIIDKCCAHYATIDASDYHLD